MDHGEYVGTKYPELVGKTAILKEPSETKVWAQFDDLSLKDRWVFGWTLHDITDFRIVIPIVVG